MKFLLKIALLILAARLLAGTPRGSNADLDAIGDFSVRQIAEGITAAVSKVQRSVSAFWAGQPPVPPRGASLSAAGEPRPEGSP